MKKQHLFYYRLFSAIFDTQQSKDDVIMDLCLLHLRDFVPYYHHAKFGGNWTTNKGETEGTQSPPPQAYINNKIPQPEWG